MSAKIMRSTFFRASALLLLVSLVVTVSSGSQDHDVPVSVDGLRCDSCGSECSVMCGSRNFRACCYNYIKKRSISWPTTGGEKNGNPTGENAEVENQESKPTSPISGTDIKSTTKMVSTSSPIKSRIYIPHQLLGGGKHIFRGYLPEIVGGDSIEEGAFLYPVSLRDLMTNMIRTLNAYENRKYGRLVF